MLTSQLSNFFIHHLIQVHIPFAIFFHCWPITQRSNIHFLQQLAADNFIYTQFINLHEINLTQDFEYKYLRQKYQYTILPVFVDLNCNESNEFLNASSRNRLYNNKYHWLIYDAEANMTNFRQQFKNANLSVDADLTYVQRIITETTTKEAYIMYDVYNNGNHIGGELNITIDREIHCTSEACAVQQYLSELHLRTKYQNRIFLTGINMRVATVVTGRPITTPHEELIEFLSSTKDPQIDTACRFGFQLLMVLNDVLGCNFTYKLYPIWSVTETSGGIMGSISDETCDLTSGLTASLLRIKYNMSLNIEMGSLLQVCIFRTPRNSGLHGDVFIKPFSFTVWLIFGCMLFLISVLLWCTFAIETRRLQRCSNFVPSLLTTVLISYGTACIQGSFIIPRSTGGRLVFIALMLSSFMMYNYYTSLVVSFLLGSPVKSNIKTLGQLADSNLEVTLEPLVYIKAYLNFSKVPDVHRFAMRKVAGRDPKTLYLPADVGVRRVRDNPGFVYGLEATSGFSLVRKYYEPNEICDLNQIQIRQERNLYLNFHKNSTYREIVRLRILRMMETGVYRKHTNYWLDTQLHCFASNSIIQVGMEYVAPLFFMLISGYMFVLILLLLEIIWKRFEQKFMRLIL